MSSHVSTSQPAERLLADRIAAFHDGLAKQAPPELIRTIVAEIDGLLRAGAGASALAVGAPAPAFTLPDVRGGDVALARLTAEGPVVLVFYRGAWCPYCDMQLRAYQEILPQIRALGAQMAAISPQTPDESLSTAEKKALAFPVLSDAGNAVARQFGLVFKVPPGLDAVHRGFGVDLARTNGDASNELPVPAVFIIGRDGRVAFRHVDADYRSRLEPAELLRQLTAAQRGSR
jgi:peroxiredoxin